jgi:hypothetical protein
MKVRINNKGEILSFEQERFFQGSINTNKLELFAPFDEDDIEFHVAFQLPDWTIKKGDGTDTSPFLVEFISYDETTELGK